MTREQQIRQLYEAFNRRDLETLLSSMVEDVRWPNGWEGGWLSGRGEVREYWERQWHAIDPSVEPVELVDRADGTTAVRVHQIAREKDGSVIADGEVVHVYRFDDDAIAEMIIEDPPAG